MGDTNSPRSKILQYFDVVMRDGVKCAKCKFGCRGLNHIGNVPHSPCQAHSGCWWAKMSKTSTPDECNCLDHFGVFSFFGSG